ncbi:hypothetical protein S83_013138 [Arachis hypogaea]
MMVPAESVFEHVLAGAPIRVSRDHSSQPQVVALPVEQTTRIPVTLRRPLLPLSPVLSATSKGCLMSSLDTRAWYWR